MDKNRQIPRQIAMKVRALGIEQRFQSGRHGPHTKALQSNVFQLLKGKTGNKTTVGQSHHTIRPSGPHADVSPPLV